MSKCTCRDFGDVLLPKGENLGGNEGRLIFLMKLVSKNLRTCLSKLKKSVYRFLRMLLSFDS
jgi:hypothetical protein